MGWKKLSVGKNAEVRKKEKVNKKKNKGKDWATMNSKDKLEIIGDDLRARGVID